MKKWTSLLEGMWAGDLEDLVQPVVSIDEYDSKIDSTAVVLGFFVGDIDAADDLNRFIQKSAVPVLDSDISAASDQRGYYIVFVELSNNTRLYTNIENILEEVGQLAKVDEWQMKVRGSKDIEEFDINRVKRYMLRNTFLDRLQDIKSKLDELKSVKKSSHKG